MSRFYFVDYPLGNPCGVPYNRSEQTEIVRSALELFSVPAPTGTVFAPYEWPRGQDWRENYMRVLPEDVERLRAAGERRKLERQKLRDIGQVRKD
ncbi:MAG: hypothetical protein OXC80_00275 [Gammaproteobacteria bacterium]|nr:hypothetical protein [Gammaproteobacteria bacterium]